MQGNNVSINNNAGLLVSIKYCINQQLSVSCQYNQFEPPLKARGWQVKQLWPFKEAEC